MFVNLAILCLVADEIISNYQQLHHKGFYVEPTSAVAIAAFDQLIKENKIGGQEIVIIVLTGNGLKTFK